MTQAHSIRAHARLAPSAAHRWMECPGSVRAEEAYPDETSSYAAEGTAAHELAAHCLQHDLDPATFLDSVVDTKGFLASDRFGDKGGDDGITRFRVTDEMVDAVRVYLDAVRSLSGKQRLIELYVEQKLDMRHIHPEIFGTGDAVVYQRATHHLHVIDFKYGKGVVVDPQRNPQLMLYGAGTVRALQNLPIGGVTLHIVQPRAPGPPVKSWATDVLDLYEFEDDIAKFAKATEADDAPLVAGDHCRFCRAAPGCPALRARSTALAIAEFGDTLPAPSTLSPAQMSAVLHEAELIGNWVKAVQEFAHAEAMAGRTPPGFKLVPKRAMRRWKDEGAVRDRLLLEMGLTDADILSEPELKSPAQMEKVVGRKNVGALADLIVSQSSGTNLVPTTDPRPAVKAEGLLEFTASVEN